MDGETTATVRRLTCRDLLSLDVGFCLDHDCYHQDESEAPRCYCAAVLGLDVVNCQAKEVIESEGLSIELCCRCADGFESADQILAEVLDALEEEPGAYPGPAIEPPDPYGSGLTDEERAAIAPLAPPVLSEAERFYLDERGRDLLTGDGHPEPVGILTSPEIKRVPREEHEAESIGLGGHHLAPEGSRQ